MSFKSNFVVLSSADTSISWPESVGQGLTGSDASSAGGHVVLEVICNKTSNVKPDGSQIKIECTQDIPPGQYTIVQGKTQPATLDFCELQLYAYGNRDGACLL